MNFTEGITAEERTGTVTNTGFFPDVDIADFVKIARMPAELDKSLLVNYLELAILNVNYQLSDLVKSSGVLADSWDSINGKNIGEILYFRAVYCLAKATILKERELITQRKEAKIENVKSPDLSENKYREFSDEAVRQLLARQEITVGLV